MDELKNLNNFSKFFFRVFVWLKPRIALFDIKNVHLVDLSIQSVLFLAINLANI